MERQTDAASTRALPLSRVAAFERSHDVVVVGHGAAGGAAAIEAARAGADTLVVERMSRGGGTTALSTGLTYFGGGTAIQKACGFEDSPENMERFVRLAAGRGQDPQAIRVRPGFPRRFPCELLRCWSYPPEETRKFAAEFFKGCPAPANPRRFYPTGKNRPARG